MEVICLQDEAFYLLIEEVVDRLKEKKNITQDKWVSPDRAMEILNIKSKTTLQKLRDEGSITFTQPQKKIILYDYDSIMKYLNNHTKKSF
ncbi:helix-turn-helix domain-containing protein [Polaribacter pectinis]|uniref:Helix-turn-helix domain-containing protein n=1 Tax=Polaribacter pectinis TaxID=2738844 RepID=A0A7G9L8H0_9FLAO|nr:helix-turn-helix domain-containing protein [Polaribacter pectinis]QNM84919.1 helix-turn-helix domain-containing protein [Polaribacter pectinis]